MNKKKELVISEIQPEPTVDSKLEFLKHMADVHHGLNEEITSDFKFAKLGDKDKEGIIEMTSNAYYGLRLLKAIEKGHKTWVFDKEKYLWKKRNLNQKEIKLIQQYEDNMFNAFMTRVYMVTTLNVNVNNNWFVRIMTGASEEDDSQEEIEENESFFEKLKRKLKRDKQKENKE